MGKIQNESYIFPTGGEVVSNSVSKERNTLQVFRIYWERPFELSNGLSVHQWVRENSSMFAW